jgi:hypothetical protein
MSDVIGHLRTTIKGLSGKSGTVYGGGLSRPLLLVSLDDKSGLAISNSEDVRNRTDAAVSRQDIHIADEHEHAVSVGLYERGDINAESRGKLRRVKA